MTDKLSRRSVLSTIFPATVVGAIFPSKAKTADQPHMRAALDALKTAQSELDKATPDKGGHRVRALRLVRQAINKVERGIKFDARR